MKVHIVTYVCEQCGVTQSAETGVKSDGICAICGSPMKIEDLFSDRRIVTLPVDEERRDDAV